MAIYQDVSVKLVNVGKKIGNKVLFEGLSIVVNSGQCLAITGPNGSGKSTLLKMIAGLVRGSTGTIQVLGDQRPLDIEERMACLGLASPEIIFYIEMTGSENILFFTQARGLTCRIEDAQEYCRVVGLGDHKDRLVYTYSTGMRQRLKFALMLAIKPRLWLLDEPSSNLDADGKSLVDKIIIDVLAEGATVIIATNEPWEEQHARYKIELA